MKDTQRNTQNAPLNVDLFQNIFHTYIFKICRRKKRVYLEGEGRRRKRGGRNKGICGEVEGG